MEILINVSTLLFCLSYLPQIAKIHKYQSVDDISIYMWYLVAGACFFGFLYSIWVQSVWFMINYLCSFTCSSVIIMQYYMYRDTRKEQIRKEVDDIIKEVRRKK